MKQNLNHNNLQYLHCRLGFLDQRIAITNILADNGCLYSSLTLDWLKRCRAEAENELRKLSN